MGFLLKEGFLTIKISLVGWTGTWRAGNGIKYSMLCLSYIYAIYSIVYSNNISFEWLWLLPVRNDQKFADNSYPFWYGW